MCVSRAGTPSIALGARLNLGLGPQVQDGSQAEPGKDSTACAVQPVQRIGSQQRPPPHRCARPRPGTRPDPED